MQNLWICLFVLFAVDDPQGGWFSILPRFVTLSPSLLNGGFLFFFDKPSNRQNMKFVTDFIFSPRWEVVRIHPTPDNWQSLIGETNQILIKPSVPDADTSDKQRAVQFFVQKGALNEQIGSMAGKTERDSMIVSPLELDRNVP